MTANADIFLERDEWSRPLALSAVLHACLFGGIFLYAAFAGRFYGEGWGGSGAGGGAMSATLVSTIPLPASPVPTENIVATESKGLSRSLPKEEEKAPEALAIPERETQKKPKEIHKVPPPRLQVENIVPFGQGGPISGPYGVFNAGSAKGGFSFTGGGDFGSRYGWYVDVVRRKVSENWLKYEIDPSISSARRVYIVFDIQRNGQPMNVQIEQSSGVPSLDMSAVRALQRIDTFGPLPGDYSGGKVSVEFWFDYRR